MNIVGKGGFPLLGLAALLLASQLSAQEPDRSAVVVVGTVEDRVQGRPLPQAFLQFSRTSPTDSLAVEVVAEVVTGSNGRFTTRALPPGEYRLLIRALGYQTLDAQVRVDGASPMDLAAELAPEAVSLDAIVVVSRRSRVLESEGFYQRRAQGFGRTFTRDEIQRRGASRTTDVLRMVPGLTLGSPDHLSSPYVFMRGGCRPDIILDGLNLGPNVPPDDIMPASSLEGLEVHRGATVPIRYRGNPCGAVVMWSIDPSVQEPGHPFSWKRMAVAGGFVVFSILFTR
jgi:hypothetical protein